MRKPTYLSPTSIKKWIENRSEFYQIYLCDLRLPRDPQTQAMSIGSAFDAYVKSALFKAIYGPINPKFEFQTLFEHQVESHNRDWALVAGEYAARVYKELGCFDDLLIQLNHAKAEPQFETDLEGPVGDVRLMGKPDAYYFNKEGHPVILDWKVNGFCAKAGHSPKPGYVKLRGDAKKTTYPGARIGMHKGTLINTGITFEAVEQDWASQLSIYAWLCGNLPGDDFVVAIDQLACGPGSSPDTPKIRVAEHRAVVGSAFQRDLMRMISHIWKCIQTEHIFDTMSLEMSQERCRELDLSSARILGQAKDPTLDSLGAGHMLF